jgi:hypothetical protein
MRKLIPITPGELLLEEFLAPHYSREFVTKPLRRQARRARGGAREGGLLETVCRLTERRARLPSGLSQRRVGGCSRSLRE